MAKLKDVLEGKAGGEFFTPDDIENKLCIVVELVGQDVEIREHDTGKKFKDDKTGKEKPQVYYCVLINNGEETKDLHLTWTGLGQFAAIMPKVDTWKGQQFVITQVQKNTKGKNTGKLDIISKGKTDVPEQMQLPKTEAPAMADYMTKIMDKLTFAGKCMPDGIPASIFTETVEAELKAARIKHDGAFNEILKALMAEGKIFEPKIGFFKVVV